MMTSTRIRPSLALAALILTVLLLAGCQPAAAPGAPAAASQVGKAVQVQGGTYTNLTPQELSAMMDQKDFVLVNVHIPFAGNLPKTDLSIPYDIIGHNLDKLPTKKSAKIVLYCRSGNMSSQAAQTLVQAGFTNIYNLDGGMDAWQQSGYKIER